MSTKAKAAAVPPPDTKKHKPGAWYGFDLDGTLAVHDPDNFDPLVVGEPVPLMVAIAKEHLAKGDDIRIVTARVSHGDDAAEKREDVIRVIQDWCEEHIGKRLEVGNEVDYQMVRFYNDRAVQVIPNTGVTLIQLVALLRRRLEASEVGVEFSPEVEAHLDDGEAS